MNALQKLRQMAGEVRRPKDPMQILPAWQLIGRLLERMPVEREVAARLCAARDVEGLDALVARLEGASSPPRADPASAQPSAEATAAEFPKDQMDKALRAFRKRLKVMRLSDESRLSGRRLTKGRVSEIDAIQPPQEFPPELWQALARTGQLRHTGQGFFSLPE